jgi:RND family efflux transporter MFP subunit
LPRVRVEQAQRGPVDRVVEVTGILSAVPGRDVKLGALVQGRLSKVTVAEGDSVKSGDVLAEIESGPASDELTQAEATVQEAEEAARAATAHRLRTEDLLRKGAASEQDAERARSDDVSARSAALRAKAAVDMARRKLSRTQLRAPFDGVVVAVYTRSGEVVDGNGQAVVEVAAPNPLELRAAVSPRDAALLRPSMGAHVRVDALKLEREGSVFAVAPAADPASGNVLVRVRLDDAEHALKLGVLARATVRVDHLDDVVTVSRDSLVPGADGGAGVVLVDDGKAHPVGVDVGFYVDGRAVVSRGLDGGESVVAQGGYALPEGAEVEVVP